MTGTAGIATSWVHLLEKEFDRSYMDLDTLLNDIEDEQSYVAYEARDKMTALSAAFGQLSHKALTVFENNRKLEQQVLTYRQQLVDAQAQHAIVNRELQHLLLQLHKAQLQATANKMVMESSNIQQRLEEELRSYRHSVERECGLEAEADVLRRENVSLRRLLVNMESELLGAKLACKYLDKELAGRIQQIQLLNGNLKPAEQDRLWGQLQAEIQLHRHKTVVKACRARLEQMLQGGEEVDGERDVIRARHMARLAPLTDRGEVRVVRIDRGLREGLGISITGGKEHGVPILVSEVHENQPAWRSGNVFVGDAILTCNGIDLQDVLHQEAVKILSNQEGPLELELLYIESEDEDDGDPPSSASASVADTKHIDTNGTLPVASGGFSRYHFFLPGEVNGNAGGASRGVSGGITPSAECSSAEETPSKKAIEEQGAGERVADFLLPDGVSNLRKELDEARPSTR